jgi:hypothetical protein
MHSFAELQDWLDENYPDLRVRQLREGAWCIEQMVDMVQTIDLDFSFDIDGFAYKEPASSLVFEVRNRMVGGWVCDELRRRDPRLAHNEGNMFHEAYKASFAAEFEHEKLKQATQQSGLNMWETAKRNPALMERLMSRMAAGDQNAWQELSPETMMKHAMRERPSELKSKDYWRSI